MIVALLKPEEANSYDRFIAGRPDATPYHTRTWLAALERSFRYRIRILVAWANNRMVGALPLARVDPLLGGRRVVSLPFSHRVPPLADDAACIVALLDETARLAAAEGCGFAEVRSGLLPVVPKGWTPVADFVCTSMLLAGEPEAQMRKLRANTRQQLVQGLAHPGLRVAALADKRGIEMFAALMAATRRRKGSLTYPKVFYEELERRLIRNDLARLELAFAGARCIAGLVTMAYGEHAVYGYSASTDDREMLRLRPLNVLMWRGILWAQARGARHFDFGTSLPDQTGLVRFKEGWGATTDPLMYYVWHDSRRTGARVAQSGKLANLASHVLRRLPLSLFARLTPYLLREVG